MLYNCFKGDECRNECHYTQFTPKVIYAKAHFTLIENKMYEFILLDII